MNSQTNSPLFPVDVHRDYLYDHIMSKSLAYKSQEAEFIGSRLTLLPRQSWVPNST